MLLIRMVTIPSRSFDLHLNRGRLNEVEMYAREAKAAAKRREPMRDDRWAAGTAAAASTNPSPP
jgi:hypothetical protein